MKMYRVIVKGNADDADGHDLKDLWDQSNQLNLWFRIKGTQMTRIIMIHYDLKDLWDQSNHSNKWFRKKGTQMTQIIMILYDL